MPSDPQPVPFIEIREQFQLELELEYYGAHLWKPRLQEGEVRVGYACTRSGEPPTKDNLRGLSAAPVVVRFTSKLVKPETVLAKPTGWTRVFPKNNAQPKNDELCIYRPIPPPGFVALGDVPVRWRDKYNGTAFNPDPDFRCVHLALVAHSEVLSPSTWNDRESMWNIQKSGFFLWAPDGDYPKDLRPYVLTNGSLFSNMTPEIHRRIPPQRVSWVPQHLSKASYNNTSDLASTQVFEGTRVSSTSVTGTWQTDNSVSIEDKLGVSNELAVAADIGPVSVTDTVTTSWEQTSTASSTKSIGGGTTQLDSQSFRQMCTVVVPARTAISVTAVQYRASYNVGFEGVLKFRGDRSDSPELPISIKGTFQYGVDSDETWWDIGNATFVSKSPGPNRS